MVNKYYDEDAISDNSYDEDDLVESTIKVSNRAKIEYAYLKGAGRNIMQKQKLAP